VRLLRAARRGLSAAISPGRARLVSVEEACPVGPDMQENPSTLSYSSVTLSCAWIARFGYGHLLVSSTIAQSADLP
jgi:hypothetical protein